ncbi:MAG: S1 RNA-binding domain-containing protein [bacterium]|nr:S1 RNA-binding domain-containing protein [bacterium]
MPTTEKNASVLTNLVKDGADIIKEIKEGDFVDATLISKGQRVAYFNLGKFGTGRVYGIEFSNSSEILKSLEIGERTSVKVLDQEDEDGYVDLSLAEAGKQKLWVQVNEVKDEDKPITVTITGANSGGLMTEVEGVKAFLPASQLANDHYPRVEDGNKEKILEELKGLIGKKLQVKIINSNQSSNKLIVSEREVAGESIKELLGGYKEGSIVEGEISGVADFGAFIKFKDQPEIEGLIHISEIDHRLIEDPKEVLKVGDKVKAQIVEIKNGRVSLSLKALKENPWEKIGEKYEAGQEIKGRVSRFNPFGAFIGLDEDIQGLIHVSEFGGVEEMKAKLELGKEYTFVIDSIKPEEKRIILKLKGSKREGEGSREQDVEKTKEKSEEKKVVDEIDEVSEGNEEEKGDPEQSNDSNESASDGAGEDIDKSEE